MDSSVCGVTTIRENLISKYIFHSSLIYNCASYYTVSHDLFENKKHFFCAMFH